MLYLVLFSVLFYQLLCTFQAISISIDRSAYPAPGRMIGVTNFDYKLHIHCMGEGTPTVIIESGLAVTTPYWSNIQPNISSFSRVCIYDRAGYGWSEAGVKPRTTLQIVSELSELLNKSSEPGPYVIVAHSFGGFTARAFTSLYPDLVSGLVLIDASSPYQEQAFWKGTNTSVEDGEAQQHQSNSMALFLKIITPMGLPRMLYPSIPGMAFPELTPHNQKAQLAYESQNEWADAVWSEMISFMGTSSQQVLDVERGFGDLPLAVLTAGQTLNGSCAEDGISDPNSQACLDYEKSVAANGAVWKTIQQEAAALSTNSTWEIVWGSTHNIALERPDVVIRTIRMICNYAKEKSE